MKRGSFIFTVLAALLAFLFLRKKKKEIRQFRAEFVYAAKPVFPEFGYTILNEKHP